MHQNPTITPESFSQLLRWLGLNAESGGVEYEMIRKRLIRFFAFRGCYEADRLADVAIDRVLARIATLEDTYVGDPVWYFLGVATKVHLEWTRQQNRTVDLEEISQAPVLDQSEDEPEFRCLDACLDSLPSETRDLILSYYTSENKDHITSRKHLAKELGISISALHIRASRIRSRLAECVAKCLEERGGKVS
ncbi:MAG TPA: hypothetical protein VGO43_02680 [Pyrinomonadaceae bacterium]|jgi:DNA-directed RNA polymerase specialized sigma24 family protein|nr:hypothetical protein [Pyrinomonadaceae bacterium]